MKRILILASLLAMIFGFAAFQCSSTELTSAKLYIQQENYEKAKEVLVEEVQKNPESAEGFYLLGYLEGEEKNYDKMMEYFDRSLEISSEFEQDIQDTKRYHWADNFNKGVSAFNQAAESTAEDTTAMYFDRSIERFQNTITIEPDSASGYKNLVFAFLNAGRTDEAVEPLETLIEMDKAADNFTILGELYINQGQQLMSQYRTSGEAEDSLAAMQKFEDAIKYLQEGRELYPTNSDILLYLSNAYINANKLDVAMDAFRDGVEQEPENKYYRYNYAVLLMEAERYTEAEEHFLKAIEIDPEYTNALYNLGALYVKWGAEMREEAEEQETGSTEYMEKFEASLPHLEKYLALNPEDAQIWELLGKVYANLGMEEESMEAFEKADQFR